MKHTLTAISLLTTLAFASASSFAAEVIYKGLDAQGRVIYTNNPKLVRNAQKVQLTPTMIEGVAPRVVDAGSFNPAMSLPAAGPLPAGLPPLPGAIENPPSSLPSASERSRQLDNKQAQIVAATERLERAKKAAATGVEPLPGERAGTAGGGSRLSNSYFSRQQNLQNEITAAQKELEEASR